MSFNKLNINQSILRAIKEMGYEEPTEIQEKCIPLVKKGIDVIGQSMTGSGKTAAFGLPLLEKVQKKGNIQMLVVAPTRELAHQIVDEFIKYTKYKMLSVVVVYGGVPLDKQQHQLRTADIVVGTPGRILDHLRRGNMDLKNVQHVVLDEADRMLDMGFIDDITTILSQTPKNRQTLLFSATFPPEIKRLIHRFMRNPTTVKVHSFLTTDMIKELYYVVEQHQKFSMLVHVIEKEKPQKALIFCGTRRNAELVSKNLFKQKFNAQLIHGGLSQNKRSRMLQLFKEGKLHILVATDVAARGLDINEVTHIINYDVPKNIDDYVHRIGRTARAGKTGMAISIVAPRDYDAFQEIEFQFRERLTKMDVENLKHVPFSLGEERGFGVRRQGGGHFGPRRQGGGSHFGVRRQGGPSGQRRFGGRGQGGQPSPRRHFGVRRQPQSRKPHYGVRRSS